MRVFCVERRRSSMSMIFVIAVAVALCGTLYVAGPSEGEVSEETVLRMGFLDKVDSLNPNVGLTQASKIFYGLVYDCLPAVGEDLEISSNLAIGCRIAEEYEPYGSVWDYNLTLNAHWHDGELFTADDVVFTLNLNANNYVSMWAYQPYAYFMDYAEKIDDCTVRVHFYDRASSEPMPVAFGLSMFIPILPKHMLEDMTPAEVGFSWIGAFEDYDPPVVGTGPFMATENIISEFNTGDRLTLVKNPYYHRTVDRLETVSFDKLEMRFYDDAFAMAVALEMGELDVAQFPPAEYLTLKDKVDSGQLQNVETYDGPKCTQYWTHVGFCMNNDGPNPSRLDPVIRQALAMATDKSYINDNYYLGLGEPGTTLIPSVNERWHYEPTVDEMYNYDIGAANDLLEANGYLYPSPDADYRVATEDSFAVQEGLVAENTVLSYEMLVRQEFPEEREIAKYLQGEWAKVGVELDYTILTESVMGVIVYTYAYDTMMWYWSADVDPMYQLFCLSKVSWAGWNDNMYTNPAYEENYTASVQELDYDLRREHVDNCQKIHYADVANIILDYVDQTYVWRTDTFAGWGDWEVNPGRSIDACWGGNPLYFDLTPAGYEPDTDSLKTSSDVTGDEGDNGWYISDVAIELKADIISSDTVAPVTYAMLSGTSGTDDWYRSAVTVELVAEDYLGDVAATYHCVDDDEWETYFAAFVISDEGEHVVKFFSVDDSGNREVNRTVSMGIDITPPSLAIDLTDGFMFNSSTAIIWFSCSDDLSGIWGGEYSLDGGGYVALYYEWISLVGLADGSHTLDVRLYDEAGNAAEDSVWFTVDATTPAVERTVDYYWYDMFNHPFGSWYETRESIYGETTVTDEYPYVYMRELSFPGNINILSFMRLDVVATGLTEVSMNENPEFLPLFSGSALGGTAEIDWYINYITLDEAERLGPAAIAWYDGWYVALNGTVTLDRDAAKAVLGISDSEFDYFDTWWVTNEAVVENDWAEWMSYEAGSDRLAIWNMYEYDLQFILFDLAAERVGDQVVVTMDTVSWGAEALLTRWLKESFMPTEWYFEDLSLHALIFPESTDIQFDAAVAYSLYAHESALDGTPCWAWEAMLQDYVEAPDGYPPSDFEPYAELDYYCVAPGSEWYGASVPYDYTPGAWNLSENETLTFEWPEGEVLFFTHDPGNTTSLIADTSEFWSNVTVEYAEPMPSDSPGSVSIDTEARQITFIGPLDMWTWSEEQSEHEWLADEWERLGILPYGVPYIEFKAVDYEPPLVSMLDRDTGLGTSAIASLSSEGISTYYRIDSGEWQTYTEPFTISEDGIHVVERYSADSEDNVEDVRTLVVKIDQTAPVLDLAVDDGAEFSADDVVNISWICSDACSGVDRLEYSLDGGVYTRCDTVGWLLLADLGDGEHVVSIRTYDEAGNFETQSLTFSVKTGGGFDIKDYALPIGIAVACAAVAIALMLMYVLRKRPGTGPPE